MSRLSSRLQMPEKYPHPWYDLLGSSCAVRIWGFMTALSIFLWRSIATGHNQRLRALNWSWLFCFCKSSLFGWVMTCDSVRLTEQALHGWAHCAVFCPFYWVKLVFLWCCGFLISLQGNFWYLLFVFAVEAGRPCHVKPLIVNSLRDKNIWGNIFIVIWHPNVSSLKKYKGLKRRRRKCWDTCWL